MTLDKVFESVQDLKAMLAKHEGSHAGLERDLAELKDDWYGPPGEQHKGGKGRLLIAEEQLKGSKKLTQWAMTTLSGVIGAITVYLADKFGGRQ